MRIDANDLIEALDAVSLIPSRSGIAQSEFVKIVQAKGTVKFFLASEIFGMTEVKGDKAEAPWVHYADRASLMPFVRAAKDLGRLSPFEFVSSKNGVLTVRQGRRKADFAKIDPINGYVEKVTVDSKPLKLTSEQKSFLTLASKYASTDPTISHLNCIYMSKGRALLASNDVAVAMVADPVLPVSVAIPSQLIAALGSEYSQTLSANQSISYLKMSCGWLAQTPNEKTKNFPKVVIAGAFEDAKKYKLRVVFSGHKLMEALKRLETYISMVVKRDFIVTVSGAQGERRIQLVCKAPQGTFQESVTAIKPVSKDFSCDWLMSHLLPLAELKSIGRIAVKFDDSKTSPYYFSADNVRVLLPKRG
jgi:hypothetical protein